MQFNCEQRSLFGSVVGVKEQREGCGPTKYVGPSHQLAISPIAKWVQASNQFLYVGLA